MLSLAVVVPTRNRPEKLHRCLVALARAREEIPFEVYVGDSSDEVTTRKAVQKVCDGFGFVHLFQHTGKNEAAARNFLTQRATAEILISVDDDVSVEQDAILLLLKKYQQEQGWRVVGGSVALGEVWSDPVVMRWIGYGRRRYSGELASFLIGGFYLYPRALGLACPWNERLPTFADMFIGALWRCKNVALLFEPRARAFHDGLPTRPEVEDQEYHIYINLFDVLLANPSLPRALAYEFLGFAAGAKSCFCHPKAAWAYVTAWYRGHRALVRDWAYLKTLVRQPLPVITKSHLIDTDLGGAEATRSRRIDLKKARNRHS